MPPVEQKKSLLTALPLWCRAHLFPLMLVLLTLILGMLEPAASQWLRYDRDAVLSGQLWRLITGNFVHFGWPHLLMNLAALILIWAIFMRVMTTFRWSVVTLAGALGVGIGLLGFSQAIQWYVGLSGVLHAILVAGIILALSAGERVQWLLLFLVAIKLLWEQMVGPLPGSASVAGGPVLVDAHLYGAAAGAIAGFLLILPVRR